MLSVPDRVWNLSESDENEPRDLRFDLDRNKEDDLWWNQKSLTNLDLSSNVLTSISSQIGNLMDLTVLNVIKKFLNGFW